MEPDTHSEVTNPKARPALPVMFRPPVNRAMRVLDRSFFQKIVPLSAARVFENKRIGNIRDQLWKSKDLLYMNRIKPVRTSIGPPEQGAQVEPEMWHGKPPANANEKNSTKCLLLREGIKHDDPSTWSPVITKLVEDKLVDIRNHPLKLDYDYWTYEDIISSILPEEDLEEAPVGFAQAGHVAHFNLRENYFQYRFLLGEILKDKLPSVRTVITKTDELGSNEFRVFPYEVIAGEHDMNVTLREGDCEFSFDFSKVYWNSRLQTEHARMIESFKEGEAVCDVMAGIGPFAIPAGKKQVFVWANDLNPYGYECMEHGIKKNKVQEFVKAFNMNGRDFIKYASETLYKSEPATVKRLIKTPRFPMTLDSKDSQGEVTTPVVRKVAAKSPPKIITSPRTFDHYVMNLPGTAIDFLDCFIGVYAGQEELFQPHTDRRLPLIHVYCFSAKSKDGIAERKDICERISEMIKYKITPDDCAGGSGDAEREVDLREVRLVAPNKLMFCATFRLPEEVAFRKG